MRRSTILLVVAGSVALIVGAKYLALSTQVADRIEQPPSASATVMNGLIVDLAHLNVGEVWDDSPAAIPLPVRNTTARPVRIAGFAQTCDCESVSPESLIIQPAATATVTVTADLTPTTPEESRNPSRPFQVSVSPKDVDGRPMGTWVVRGTARSRITVSDPKLHFGDVLPGRPFPVLSTTVRTHAPVSDLVVAADLPNIKVTACRRTDDPSQYDIRLTPTAGLAPGPFAGRVALTLTAPDGTATTLRLIQFDGVMVAAVRATPGHLLFGRLASGSVAEADVVLRGPAAPPSVLRVTADRPELSVALAPAAKAATGKSIYRVTVRPKQLGSYASTVSFIVRDTEGRELTLPVAVWFEVVPAEPAEGAKP